MAQNQDRELPAIKIEQGGIRLFLTYLRASDVVNGMTEVDAWTPTNRDGYQRESIPSRFKKIASYVRGKEGVDPLLPQAVVLNVREQDKKLKFQSLNGSNIGTLVISHDQTLWEVDGQHRLGGLRYAVGEEPRLGQYTIPVVITEGLARLDEAVLFYVINTTQKRVPTDLAQRLIAQKMKDEGHRMRIIAEGKAWIPKATDIVDNLMKSDGHPWYGKIGIPGTKISGILMKQVSFVNSLKPILDGAGIYRNLDTDDVTQLLIRYWQAIEEVFPEAIAEPKQHVIQKTVGVFPLHTVATQVFDLVRTKESVITKDGLVEVLRSIDANIKNEGLYEAGSTFWHSKEGEAGKFTGAKGFRLLADILERNMPEMKTLKVV